MLLVSLLGSLGANASGLPAPEDLRNLAEQLRVKADEIVVQHDVVGLGVGLVYGREVLLAHGAGVTEVGPRGTAVDSQTVFRIASVSKGFAATLAGLLVEDRLIRWDTPVTHWLPTLELRAPADASRLTVEDVLSHRVGLPRHALDIGIQGNEPYPVLVERLAEVRAVCATGTCYGYQNVAFSLIGDVALAVTGRFFNVEVERRLLHPLGMMDSSFGLEPLLAEANWARPHVRAGRGWRSVDVKPTYYRVAPAAGINASVRDLNRWMSAQLGHAQDVLGQDLLAELHRPRVRTDIELRNRGWRAERLRDAQYALGWRVFDYAGERMIFHGGAVQGYRAVMAMLPEHDIGLVVVWNCESAAPSGLLPTTMDRVLGLPPVNWLELDLGESSG